MTHPVIPSKNETNGFNSFLFVQAIVIEKTHFPGPLLKARNTKGHLLPAIHSNTSVGTVMQWFGQCN